MCECVLVCEPMTVCVCVHECACVSVCSVNRSLCQGVSVFVHMQVIHAPEHACTFIHANMNHTTAVKQLFIQLHSHNKHKCLQSYLSSHPVHTAQNNNQLQSRQHSQSREIDQSIHTALFGAYHIHSLGTCFVMNRL